MMDINKALGKMMGGSDDYEDRAEMIYEDNEGNKVFQKHIKSRGVIQYHAKNANGQLINPKGTQMLLKKAGVGLKMTSIKHKGKSGMKIWKTR